ATKAGTQPATPAAAPAKAEITIVVPADAEIFFDGSPTTRKGTERLFVTPPLEVGGKYHYEIQARWKKDGKPVEETRKVPVTGGARVRVVFLAPAAEKKQLRSKDETSQLGTDAYVYGSPLVTMEMPRRVITNVATVEPPHAPMGQFVNMREYPTAADKEVTAPNADTLYSFVWLDLSKEPYVFSFPYPKAPHF